MVTIRLSRTGGKKRPFYHIAVADRRQKRDGRFVEQVGFFNPVAKGGEEKLRIDVDRVDYWRRQGAQLTPRVKSLVREYRKSVAGDAGEAAA